MKKQICFTCNNYAFAEGKSHKDGLAKKLYGCRYNIDILFHLITKCNKYDGPERQKN